MPRPSDETGRATLDDLVHALDAEIQTMTSELEARRTATGTILPSPAALLEKLTSRLFTSVQGYTLFFTEGRTCYIDPRGAGGLLGYAPTEEMLSRFITRIVAETYDQK